LTHPVRGVVWKATQRGSLHVTQHRLEGDLKKTQLQ